MLIVGAGPVGITLACELSRRGVPCRVIDSLSVPSEKSRALAIHARTLEVFEMMGVIDQFLSVGWQSNAFVVFDRKKPIVRMTFSGLESRYPFLLSLPQTHTERILAERFGINGGAIEWNTTLVGLRQGVGGVEAVLRKDDGSEEAVSCEWLVGSDGAHSSVRRMINMPFRGMPYWEQYVLADVDFESELDPRDHYVFSNRDGIAGLHAFGPNEGRIFAEIGRIRRPRITTDTLPPDRAEFPEPTMEQLQEILDQRGPGTTRLTKLNWLSMHTIHRRQVTSYRDGRVLLAGDSAHIHSPTAGQGMNMGIQDAFNLGWKLALVHQGVAGESLIDSYCFERKLVGKQTIVMSDFFSRINNVRSPLLQVIRNKVGPLLAVDEGIREHYRNAVSQLAANYKLSPAVQNGDDFARTAGDTGKSSPSAGERAPDYALMDVSSKPLRLFELLRSEGHYLLFFAGSADAQARKQFLEIERHILQAYSKTIQTAWIISGKSDSLPEAAKGHKLFDPELGMHEKYGAVSSGAMYLIRPDGYVAFRSASADLGALINYLKSIFI